MKNVLKCICYLTGLLYTQIASPGWNMKKIPWNMFPDLPVAGWGLSLGPYTWKKMKDIFIKILRKYDLNNWSRWYKVGELYINKRQVDVLIVLRLPENNLDDAILCNSLDLNVSFFLSVQTFFYRKNNGLPMFQVNTYEYKDWGSKF